MRWQPYPKYKDSGVDWLGEVPEGWEVKAIKWASSVQRGASPRPIDNPIYFDDEGEYAWVRIADVTSSEKFLTITTQQLSALGSSLSIKINPGELFLSIAATVGKPCIANIKCCIHDGFVYFPQYKDSIEFLYYIFACGRAYEGLGKFGTQLNLNTDTVGGIKIALPPLPEQQTIATFLDKETGHIDALVAKKKALIEKLKEQRTAIISSAVTKGLTPDVAPQYGLASHTRFKPSGVDWLGDIPEGWEVKAIKWISSVQRGASPRPIDDPVYFDDEGEYAWVRIADVTASDRYLTHTTQRLSELGSSLSVKIAPEQLFLSIAATVGKPCIAKIKCCIHDGFVYFPQLKEDTGFIFYIFACGQPYLGLGKFGTQLNLNTDTVGSIKIAIPPLKEQQAIAAYLDEQTAKIDNLIAKVEQAINTLQEYRSALITAAVTGKIDVRCTTSLQEVS